MIKYVELTAPEASAFRQAKIVSIECAEGDYIKAGDTIFRVQSGAHEINLPAIKAGRVVELIASLQENITLSTALLLLETEVENSTASKPLSDDEQASLASVQTKLASNESDDARAVNDSMIRTEQAIAEPINDDPTLKDNRNKAKKKVVKTHQQQTLDLMGDASIEQQAEPEVLAVSQTTKNVTDENEVVLTQKVASAPIEPLQPTQTSLTMSSSSILKVTVPDIGADSAKVIEILVNVGDQVSTEDPLITLESDKASMDVPSPSDGVVKSISVSVDDDLSEGSLILELESDASTVADSPSPSPTAASKVETTTQPRANEISTPEPVSTNPETAPSIIDVHIPDIGGDSAKVIEILVNVGDQVDIEDPLVTLESDKASMDVPSSSAGTIKSIEVSIDQDVSEGVVVVKLLTATETSSDQAKQSEASASQQAAPAMKQAESVHAGTSSPAPTTQVSPAQGDSKSHASPSIRRFARELGANLSLINGTGRKGRITHDDVKVFVKGELSKPRQSSTSTSQGGSGIQAIPAQDFTRFGEVDVQPLNKIKRLTAENLHRSWLNVPHVTHNDESNISDLEAFRKQLNKEYAHQKRDLKLSPLAFIVKAVVNAMQLYPQFNSSLETGGENLIYKKYFNIGIAVETPNGLVVPVVKDADKKSVAEIATEMGELAKKARDKKLTMNDMSGACFTISSLGGIGGTGFTPIVNAPEVAILGVSRSKMQPVWNGSDFEPGMILPLSLSYDHRVIDGAEAARFTRHIAAVLEDVRRLTV